MSNPSEILMSDGSQMQDLFGYENAEEVNRVKRRAPEELRRFKSNGRSATMMLVSKRDSRYKAIDGRKVSNGTFYTTKASWLTKPVRSFFKEKIAFNKHVLDPFAGVGDILECLQRDYGIVGHGYDIAGNRWVDNDSLLYVPNPHKYLVCTNPPYLAKHSAKRKGVWKLVRKYYAKYYDLYETAISKCMENADAGIFIVPETFLHSNLLKNQLRLVSVILKNPFSDTENPVCVACFDSSHEGGAENAEVYIEDRYVCRMADIDRRAYVANSYHHISFNNPKGNVALKAVDGTNPEDRIRFERPEGFYYDRYRIVCSSRLVTYIEVGGVLNLDDFLQELNERLERIRYDTDDLILSPFKGNNKAGQRRRRLDYRLARYLISETLGRSQCLPMG